MGDTVTVSVVAWPIVTGSGDAETTIEVGIFAIARMSCPA
jgi:hypothetical protein